jgi:amylosucrase
MLNSRLWALTRGIACSSSIAPLATNEIMTPDRLEAVWLERQAQVSLERLLPRLEAQCTAPADGAGWGLFVQRLSTHFPRLFRLLYQLYGDQYDFFYHLESILITATRLALARPPELRALDAAREADPGWFQSNQMVGGVCYADLFAGDLRGVRDKIPYFRELGLTYLHVMPPFQCPEGNSDGGYAVSSYREVNPALGTIDDLAALATDLRHNGISLVLDFVFNHTSDEHAWAQRARAGDPAYREFYQVFPDRTQPDAFEKTLREIFPDEHPGAFTFVPDMRGWVWTTFHSFQWDLNYSNPAVFNAMAEELLSLANLGVEVLRLDAVAFTWKSLGTSCENLPEAHQLIQAFNAMARIAAPALLFKSEAIVHPDEVVKYIGRDECQLSYNPLLMALLWNSLATRKVRLLAQALRQRFRIPPDCAWVNYVRVHDDIGWTFSDEDAALLGVKGYDHRQFLNQFYTGRSPGSFAAGLPFQENPKTGDCRISGTCASLAGLEKALRDGSAAEVELAIRRILLIHGLIVSAGGIPLIYLGDEIGTLNDYSYRDDPAKANDSRWVHRSAMNWERAGSRHDGNSLEGRIYGGLGRLIELRKRHPAFRAGSLEVLDTGSDHVLAYRCARGGEQLIVAANFSERPEVIAEQYVRAAIGGKPAIDLITSRAYAPGRDLDLAPYEFAWFCST